MRDLLRYCRTPTRMPHMRGIVTMLLALFVAGCAEKGSTSAGAEAVARRGPVPLAELPQIDTAAVLEDTKVLASDRFEGRAPGTPGEELTVNYLVEQFKKAGLEPGNTGG